MNLRAVASLYMASPQWEALSSQSKRLYRHAMKHLEPLMEIEMKEITRPMVIDLKDSLHEKGATCRLAMAVLSNIFSHAYDRGLADGNHAARVRHMPKSEPIKRWTEEECRTFIDTAPKHLKEAFLLALYTGQRRSDLARMRWGQYDGIHIAIIQQKTKRVLKIPVHRELKETLDKMLVEKPSSQRSHYIINNSFYKPWTMVGLTMAITNHARKVGIKGKSIHGIRKTTAAKLAELGCSPHLIGAITGHASLKELENYTAEADQVRMAQEAIRKWEA